MANASKIQWAEEHVVRARTIVAEQEDRILQIEFAGGNSRRMQELLETFRELLAVFEEDLIRIRHEN